MVTQYGMSEKLGPLTFGKKEEMVFLGREISEQRNYSDEVAAKIDAEVREIIDRAYERAKEALTTHREVLDRLAALLIEKETIEAEEFESLFEGVLPPRIRRTDAAQPPSARAARRRRAEADAEAPSEGRAQAPSAGSRTTAGLTVFDASTNATDEARLAAEAGLVAARRRAATSLRGRIAPSGLSRP